MEIYNARAYARKHPFIILKATQGTDFIDPAHAERCESTHLQGMAVGHYHYMDGFSNGDRAIDEADHFLKITIPHFIDHTPKSGLHSDFFVLDIETPQAIPNECIATFENRINALCKQPVICYTGLSYFEEHALTCRTGKWWLAAYPGPLPLRLPRKQAIWAHQYSANGKTEGIAGDCDMSVLIDRASIKYWS